MNQNITSETMKTDISDIEKINSTESNYQIKEQNKQNFCTKTKIVITITIIIVTLSLGGIIAFLIIRKKPKKHNLPSNTPDDQSLIINNSSNSEPFSSDINQDLSESITNTEKINPSSILLSSDIAIPESSKISQTDSTSKIPDENSELSDSQTEKSNEIDEDKISDSLESKPSNSEIIKEK